MADPPLRLTGTVRRGRGAPPARDGVRVRDEPTATPDRPAVPFRELAVAIGLVAVSCWLADRVAPFPWNAVVLGLGFVLAGAFIAAGRRRTRREREALAEAVSLPDLRFRRCTACGYTLNPEGSAQPRLCPECNTPTMRLAR